MTDEPLGHVDLGEFQRVWEAQQQAKTRSSEQRRQAADRKTSLNGHAAPGAAAEAPPFLTLGFNEGRHYFLPEATCQIVVLTTRQLHNPAELAALAPLEWWQVSYPKAAGTRQDFAVSLAANQLLKTCHEAGVFDLRRFRGPGTWLDAGRTVVHLGDRLLVDGQPATLGRLANSGWLYLRGRQIEFDPRAEPAIDQEAALLIRLCAHIGFVHPERDAMLLAGWLAISMVGGALSWRPHAWLIGEPGCGKTWVIEHVVQKLLGGRCVMAAGKSTEPGLRRVMGNDARVLLYDEAEGDTPASQARLAAILELLRQSSSESSAELLQAASPGSTELLRFRPRFTSVLGSVHLSLTNSADASRFMVMPLRESGPEAFAELRRREAACFTPGFCDRLFVRLLRQLPTILANIQTLRDAIAVCGNTRAGDTLGTAMAGFLALQGDERLTPERAAAMVAQRPWLQQAAAEQVPQAEWRRMFHHIGQQRLRIGLGSSAAEVAVSEAVAVLSGREQGPAVKTENLERAMGQAGLRVINGQLLLSNESVRIPEWLSGTAWAAGWKSTAMRAPGAGRAGSTYLPGLGTTQRCMSLPVSVFLGTEVVLDGDGDTYTKTIS